MKLIKRGRYRESGPSFDATMECLRQSVHFDRRTSVNGLSNTDACRDGAVSLPLLYS